MTRQGTGWHILEVKSSFSDTGKIKEIVDDLAYTAMVCRRGGIDVQRASLLFLSRGYRFADAPGKLFEVVDATTDVFARVGEFDGMADRLASELFHDSPPSPVLISACRECDYFSEDCLGAGFQHTVLEIPALHHKKLKRLSTEGIIDLAKVPDDLELNGRQERAKAGALSGKLVVEASLSVALQGIEWPCHYLDFETVATVMPLYEGHACHQQVLTQFSVHHRASIAAEITHSEYLADASRDCQKEVAQALIAALGDQGAIIVYSSFEKTRISALRNSFPDLADALDALLQRLVDLHTVVADNVYHPDFQGSFSIKKVLPALVPELSYKSLAVGDGDTAITRFARMARGEITSDQIDVTRQQLLDYCKLDTLAMVRLHERLYDICPPQSQSVAT